MQLEEPIRPGVRLDYKTLRRINPAAAQRVFDPPSRPGIPGLRDHKALTKEQLLHLDRYEVPNYQWGALDVNSRFKPMAYSQEKSWTNGSKSLRPMLLSLDYLLVE